MWGHMGNSFPHSFPCGEIKEVRKVKSNVTPSVLPTNVTPSVLLTIYKLQRTSTLYPMEKEIAKLNDPPHPRPPQNTSLRDSYYPEVKRIAKLGFLKITLIAPSFLIYVWAMLVSAFRTLVPRKKRPQPASQPRK